MLKKYSIEELKTAHSFSIRNFNSIKASNKVGCFYCCKKFEPAEITDWITESDGQKTALCPKCPIDSVIGDACGVPITIKFLQAMHGYFF